MTLFPCPKPTRTPKVRKPMKRFNAKRGGSAFWKRKNKPFRDFVRAEGCILRGRTTFERMTINDAETGCWTPSNRYRRVYVHRCWGPVDPAHIDTTQARGAYDVGEVVGLCRSAHRVLDRIKRPAFEAATKLDLAYEAGGLALKWVERGGSVAKHLGGAESPEARDQTLEAP